MKTVFELDDLCDEMDPYDELVRLRQDNPDLKVTLFAIPTRCSDELLARYRALDWVEIGVHGYHHSSRECLVWGYEEACEKLNALEAAGWTKLFKPPNWQINEEVYKALHFLGWAVADHAAYAWSSMSLPIRRYTYNLPGRDLRGIHGHTWDTCDNGPSDWQQMLEGVEGEFVFVSDVLEEKVWGYKGYDRVQDEESSWSHQSDFGKLSWHHFNIAFDGMDAGSIGDFGGNDGFVARLAVDAGRDVTVMDSSANRVEFADRKHGVKAICCDLTDIPLSDKAFDWGYCSHVLEHIDDIHAAWSEIKRLCRVGCMVVLPVETKEEFEGNPAHFHMADAEGWEQLLGFKVIHEYPGGIIAKWEAE